MNQVVLMGRLTRDPELRHTPNGVAVASFTLAVDRDIKQKDGERQTDFINIVAWRSTGEFVAKYFTKGQMCALTGSLQMRNWTDKDGNKRTNAEVVADHVYFVEGKRKNENQNTQQNTESEKAEEDDEEEFTELDDSDDEDLPF